MATLVKLYRTLHDQLESAAYLRALKTCKRILRQSPNDELALATELQLVLALEEYPVALSHPSTGPVERAYALYKSARTAEAKRVVDEYLDEHDDDGDVQVEARAARVVSAQIAYRQGDFELSRDLFDELASTVDSDDSPELADLVHNSRLCSAHLEFVSSVPNLVARSVSNDDDPAALERLERAPLSTLLLASSASAFPSSSSSSSSSTRLIASGSPRSTTATPRARPRLVEVVDESPSSSSSPALTTIRSRRPLKHRASLDPSRVPAPDRWIPKRERPSMRDELLQNKEKARGRKKDKKARDEGGGGTMQGGVVVEPSTRQSTQAGGGGGGGGGGGTPSKGKKKKGKR
ncbi:hypothetical protein JCM10212_002490 [Sporobolomyces blumeae]